MAGPIDVTLVGPRIAARLKLDTDGADDFSGAAVDAARAKMRIQAPTLEIDYQLERKPPSNQRAAEPQFWVVDEVTRPGLGLVGRDQLLAVCEALAADMIGSDVALSSTLYTFMLDFDTANRLAVKGEVKRRDTGSSFHALSGRNSSSAEYTALLAAVSTCTDATTQEKWVRAQLRQMVDAGAIAWPGSATQIQGFETSPPRFRSVAAVEAAAAAQEPVEEEEAAPSRRHAPAAKWKNCCG